MLEALMWLLIGTVPVLAWLCGYYFGKVDGIREVRHLMDEQRKNYEKEWLRMARGEMSAVRWRTGKLRDANRTIRKLLDENARLRDLARHMRDCIGSYGKATGDFGCDLCSRNNDTGECDFDARMRELGVNE